MNRWELYEWRKQELKQQELTPEEYEQAVKDLAEELRL